MTLDVYHGRKTTTTQQQQHQSVYSRTSVARTLMARLPWLVRTRSWVARKKSKSCRFGIIKGGVPFYIENGILCLLIRIASMRRF